MVKLENEENQMPIQTEDSKFSSKDKIIFFKKKWRKDHRFYMIFSLVILIALLVIGIVFDNVIKFIVPVLAFVYYIISYNKMMSYVEANVYVKSN